MLLLIPSVFSRYNLSAEAAQILLFLLKNGKISIGCSRFGPDVLMGSGILICICFSLISMFLIFMDENVCMRCPIMSDSNVINLNASCFNGKFFTFCFEKKSRTILGSQVMLYLGSDGFYFDMPLKNLLILKSCAISDSINREIADL